MALYQILNNDISAKDLSTCFANLEMDSKSVKHRVKVFPDDVCGSCGLEKADGDADLLVCGKCKKRCYCSTECQKSHWNEHKKDCPGAGSVK